MRLFTLISSISGSIIVVDKIVLEAGGKKHRVQVFPEVELSPDAYGTRTGLPNNFEVRGGVLLIGASFEMLGSLLAILERT